MNITDKQLSKLRTEEDSLINAVISDLEERNEENERDGYLTDLLQHGCQSGMVSGLISYHETTAFFDKYSVEIWTLASEQADEFGHENVFQFLGCLNGADHVSDYTTFKTLLAWYAYEETARNIANQLGLEI